MYYFVALVTLLSLTGLSEGCGKRYFSARVVGGENAMPYSWPWQISLRIFYNGQWVHICGGSLINSEWVVTASHCVVDWDNTAGSPETYKVVVGAHERLGTTAVQEFVQVKKVFAHESFSMTNLKNDIALLQLSKPVKLSDKVSPVCLPTQGSRIAEGHKCYITGWGRTVGGGAVANILQQAMLPVQSPESCSKVNDPLIPSKVDETSMICGGSGISNQAGGCQGDSGGPYVCEEGGKWVLRGAVSWGHGMCRTKHFTVFARVSSFRDWIELKMGGGGQ